MTEHLHIHNQPELLFKWALSFTAIDADTTKPSIDESRCSISNLQPTSDFELCERCPTGDYQTSARCVTSSAAKIFFLFIPAWLWLTEAFPLAWKRISFFSPALGSAAWLPPSFLWCQWGCCVLLGEVGRVHYVILSPTLRSVFAVLLPNSKWKMPIKVTFKKLLVQGHCTILYFLWSVTCSEALVQSKQEWHVLSVLYTELYSVNYKLGYFFKISATTHWPTTYCVQIWTQLIKNTW